MRVVTRLCFWGGKLRPPFNNNFAISSRCARPWHLDHDPEHHATITLTASNRHTTTTPLWLLCPTDYWRMLLYEVTHWTLSHLCVASPIFSVNTNNRQPCIFQRCRWQQYYFHSSLKRGGAQAMTDIGPHQRQSVMVWQKIYSMFSRQSQADKSAWFSQKIKSKSNPKINWSLYARTTDHMYQINVFFVRRVRDRVKTNIKSIWIN